MVLSAFNIDHVIDQVNTTSEHAEEHECPGDRQEVWRAIVWNVKQKTGKRRAA